MCFCTEDLIVRLDAYSYLRPTYNFRKSAACTLPPLFLTTDRTPRSIDTTPAPQPAYHEAPSPYSPRRCGRLRTIHCRKLELRAQRHVSYVLSLATCALLNATRISPNNLAVPNFHVSGDGQVPTLVNPLRSSLGQHLTVAAFRQNHPHASIPWQS